MFDDLYDLVESSNVNFVGCVSEASRYDFAIVYTKHFFGKPLVICMQTGRSSLLCADDLTDNELLRSRFQVPNDQAADELRNLLSNRLPTINSNEQF